MCYDDQRKIWSYKCQHPAPAMCKDAIELYTAATSPDEKLAAMCPKQRPDGMPDEHTEIIIDADCIRCWTKKQPMFENAQEEEKFVQEMKDYKEKEKVKCRRILDERAEKERLDEIKDTEARKWVIDNRPYDKWKREQLGERNKKQKQKSGAQGKAPSLFSRLGSGLGLGKKVTK